MVKKSGNAEPETIVIEETKEEPKEGPVRKLKLEDIPQKLKDEIVREHVEREKILGTALVQLSNARNDIIQGLQRLMNESGKDTTLLSSSVLNEKTIKILVDLGLLQLPKEREK